jgi:hypothetical protein
LDTSESDEEEGADDVEDLGEERDGKEEAEPSKKLTGKKVTIFLSIGPVRLSFLCESERSDWH